MRECSKTRKTSETEVSVKLNLDGAGLYKINTGINFFNHMLEQLAYHASFDLELDVVSHDKNSHHIIEDAAITLGSALLEALADKKGIKRYGEKILPMDDALVMCSLDISGRAFSKIAADIKDERTSDFETVLFYHFFSSLAQNALMTIHIRMLDGFDTHHIIEASFKAFAQALKTAVSIDPAKLDAAPSTKGCI